MIFQSSCTPPLLHPQTDGEKGHRFQLCHQFLAACNPSGSRCGNGPNEPVHIEFDGHS